VRVAHLALAGFALLLAPRAATAGPVWVQYRFDSYACPSSEPPGGSAKFEQHGSGQLALDGVRTLAAFRFMPLAPVMPDAADSAGTSPFGGVTRFVMKVELTDMASDEMGVVRITGAATSSWTRGPDGSVHAGPATVMFDDYPQTLILGGHPYDILATGGTSTAGEDVAAYVSVRYLDVVLEQTPEPATGALAAVGVVGVTWMTARRRRARAKLSS